MKHINKSKLRKISIDNEIYLWKAGHYHLTEFKHSKCAEKVTVYLEGFKNAPLNLLFREEDNDENSIQKWIVGYPNTGIIWLFIENDSNKPQTESVSINLNRPAVIRKIIEYFSSNGWSPKTSNKPFIVSNGLELLDKIDFPNGIK
ncbi:hypothetical protein [Chondrinema litorale]|uniref:hypothetical protein n=1 Tax=Chondrinema litorale TaxID=2994555 RepID=UPI0025427BF2|nr:hypothetical protein [Chondrinema litorale]UZR97270.1 hypothetical protein OQ292_25555 [Chondrinema litorale]